MPVKWLATIIEKMTILQINLLRKKTSISFENLCASDK